MTSSLRQDEADLIRVLQPEDVEQLRLGWWSRFDATQVDRVLAASPGLSVWMPSTHEYCLVGPWRHRSEIVHIVELVSIRHPVDLTIGVIENARAARHRLFISVEMSERLQQSYYDRTGLMLLEDVLSYELVPGSFRSEPGSTPDLTLVDVNDGESLGALLEIDWAAFPWLWRNSEEEFRDYAKQTGVELHLLRFGGENIGYIGITCFPGWGHIDRVAVKPQMQGQGYGAALTKAAISRLMHLGATRIGLSTQRRNARSQRLYTGLGFRRQQNGDYRIFGRTLWPEDDLEVLVNGGAQ